MRKTQRLDLWPSLLEVHRRATPDGSKSELVTFWPAVVMLAASL
jgi:hypothetical protein